MPPPLSARRRATVLPMRATAAHGPPVHPFDVRYGTDTGGLIPRTELLTGHENDAHITAYYAVAPSILDGLIDRWLETRPARPIEQWTFLDAGAGKGRALMAAALHPFRAVTGIELNPRLARLATANLEQFARSAVDTQLARPTVVEGDVLAVELPATPTLAFLFHPFEAPVLRRFAARAAEHFLACAAPFDLLYVNAEHSSVLDDDTRFRRLFHGSVAMTTADHVADLEAIAGQTEYGSTGEELCSIFRLTPPVSAPVTESRNPRRRPAPSRGSECRVRSAIERRW